MEITVAIAGDPGSCWIQNPNAIGECHNLIEDRRPELPWHSFPPQGRQDLIGNAPSKNTGVIPIAQNHAIDVIVKAFPCYRFMIVDLHGTGVDLALIENCNAHLVGEFKIESWPQVCV